MSDATDMADSPAPAATGSKKKLMVIAAAGVLALAGAGGAAWFFLGNQDERPAAEIRNTAFLDLPDIIVNLNTTGGGTEYLKLAITLEVTDAAMLETVNPRLPRVLDAFQVYLRELRRSDLEGSAGVYRLKEELRRRVNLAIYPATVDDILFKEILIQ